MSGQGLPGAIGAAACFAALAVPAGAVEPRPVEVEIGATRESLTRNLPDWSSVYLEAARTFRPRNTLYGGVRQTRRFDLDDNEAYGGLYYPLGETWTALIEASLSPSHSVLPQFSAFGQLQKTVAPGLVVGLGLKHTEYSDSGVKAAIASVEYYWSAFRAAYTFYSSQVDGAGSAPAHRFQANYYYTDHSSIGISYASGREVESVGPPVGLVVSDVREWAVSGRHWFSRGWALTYELLDHEQGRLYRRQGARLGLRHRF